MARTWSSSAARFWRRSRDSSLLWGSTLTVMTRRCPLGRIMIWRLEESSLDAAVLDPFVGGSPRARGNWRRARHISRVSLRSAAQLGPTGQARMLLGGAGVRGGLARGRADFRRHRLCYGEDSARALWSRGSTV
ncbi:extensin [Iris pallida]|uniref:Extensin n=1 Tax=Iris pallida TaxID=29817 RepID=A0AAX6GT80_IRIPA|nr:extensin [Iris pallida]